MPLPPNTGALDFGRTRQRGDDDIGFARHALGRFGPSRAFRQIRIGGGLAHVVDQERITGLLQIARNADPMVPRPMKRTVILSVIVNPGSRRIRPNHFSTVRRSISSSVSSPTVFMIAS